jgi:type IV pilus assembly protein PilB
MAGLRVSEDELRALFVKRLEVISDLEFDKARSMATRLRIPLERALVESGRIPFRFLLKQIAEAMGVAFIDLKPGDVHPDALRTVREEVARAHALVPFARTEFDLHVAMGDPHDESVIDDVQRMTGLRVIPFLAAESAIRRAHLLYRGEIRELLERSVTEEVLEIEQPERLAEEQHPVAELLDRLLEYAAVARASDIHIEPYEFQTVIRCRIDGVLHDVLTLPSALLPLLVARIKILSGMRIDERRAPQDGSFEADREGLRLDLRVATIATVWGEKVVMRVHPKQDVPLDLEDLGLSSADYEIVLRNLRRPFGMILVTGPTASGKTTSLYAILTKLGAERPTLLNISTIEDPVEYRMPRVNQIQTNPEAGIEFATALRALLRQDPDVLMVGEIRDRETAEIAVRTALAGRLLLSTLHTNDATGAVPRLIDMGIEPFLLASTLTFVIAQRLARRICTSCRESVTPDPATLAALRSRPDFEQTIATLRRDGVLGQTDDPYSVLRLYRGRGCRQCNSTGFRGRVAVFELFEVDDQIRGMIVERRDGAAIRTAAIAAGMKTIFQDGLTKALLGDTTIEEVFRVAL